MYRAEVQTSIYPHNLQSYLCGKIMKMSQKLLPLEIVIECRIEEDEHEFLIKILDHLSEYLKYKFKLNALCIHNY